jgi:hypothetical protein
LRQGERKKMMLLSFVLTIINMKASFISEGLPD